MRAFMLCAAMVCGITGCNRSRTESNVDAPGADKSVKTSALEAGAGALQTQPPIGAINAYLDGFHFYSGHMNGQMEAHHFCSILNEDVIQCVIYDGNVKDAKLMGVEYIISEKLFSGLPAAEKALWHSHVHEVKSGQLVAPGIPQSAEHELMEKLVHTYGKTWHTWHTDLDKQLPLGVPQLMMGPTMEGQIDPQMIKARDQRLRIDSDEKKRNRADIVAPAIDPDANGWQHGKTFQIDDPTGSQHDYEHAAAKKTQPPPLTENTRSE
jgi:hypothetical protein